MKRSRQAGFTLVEVLVGVTLLALIAALLGGALRLGLRGSERANARIEETETLRTAQLLLRRQIEQAVPLLFNDETRGDLAFRGSAERLDFVADMTGRDGRQALWLVRLSIERGEGGDALYFLRRPLTAGPAAFVFGPDAERGLLLQHTGLRFDYFDGRRWLPSWSAPEEFPRLVRLRAGELAEAAWPELVVAPRLSRGQL